MNYINYLIKLNGLYDILCSLSILKIIKIPLLNKLHTNLIKKEFRTNILKRFYAYWIFTYGLIRLNNNNNLITYSYIIEAISIYIEIYKYKTLYLYNSFKVIDISLIFSILSLKI